MSVFLIFSLNIFNLGPTLDYFFPKPFKMPIGTNTWDVETYTYLLNYSNKVENKHSTNFFYRLLLYNEVKYFLKFYSYFDIFLFSL